jgi:hypothetical protein
MTKVHIHVFARSRKACDIVARDGHRHGIRNMAADAFEEREKEFEARFKHDQELRFKVTARRNRLLGLWAAERMGLKGEAAERYARAVVDAEFEGGDPRVVGKVCADLNAKGDSCTEAQVKFELDHFADRAKQQIMQE